jgi:arylsulfatase A-like enzyme
MKNSKVLEISKVFRSLALVSASVALGLVSLTASSLLPSHILAADKAKFPAPNIVLIVADDLGYADISTYTQIRQIPTPHIDSIGKDGVIFTHGYVTAPICAPSRAGFLTGRYQQRFGVEYLDHPKLRAPDVSYGITQSETTLGAALQKAGYRTALIGKWHLGSEAGFYPTERGFDEFYGLPGGSTPYIDPNRPEAVVYDMSEEEAAVGSKMPGNPKPKDWSKRTGDQLLMTGAERRIVDNMDVYLTDDLAEKAADFIGRSAGKPFLLYLSFTAPHTPFQTTRKYYDRFPEIKDEKLRIYAGMISALDDGVGRVLKTLADKGIADNTLIIFIADNGCAGYTGVCLCEPLRGIKQSQFEGGVRVPYLMRWRTRIQGGLVYDQPVSALDIFPTSVIAAGDKLAEDRVHDGVDLMPYVAGNRKGAPHPELYWLRRPQASVIDNGWKLWISDDGKVKLLFDLTSDPNEKNNLYDKRPDKVAALSKKLSAWRADMVEPLWPSINVNVNVCGQDMILPR